MNMKYLKTFEGHGRIEMSKDGKQALAGPATLPQNWEWDKEQKVGFNPNDLLMPGDNSYNYLMDPEDYLDKKDVDKMMEPHVQKYGEFGFDPSKI